MSSPLDPAQPGLSSRSLGHPADSSLAPHDVAALFDRRGFLTSAGALSLGALLAACSGDGGPSGPGGTLPLPAGVVLSGNTLQIDLTVVTGLAQTNGYLVVAQPATIVLNLGSNLFRAFTGECTHAACLVANFSNGTINCVCHGSRFDTQGNVVEGPARRALRSFAVSVDAANNRVSVITS